MPTPSAKRALPQIAGSDSPDIPRDVNALITSLEAEVGYLAERDVLETGLPGQTRAGRALVLADFTDLGLTAPLGLWNLSDLTDASGNGRNLVNKGAVPFGIGIEGAASTAAIFAGSTAQALYIADTGAADPFRIRTGSWSCWFNCARGGDQRLFSKEMATGASATSGFALSINTSGTVRGWCTAGTVDTTCDAISGVVDARWHHAVVTFDGSAMKVYVDGILEQVTVSTGGVINPAASAPLNIGGRGADAATAPTLPTYARVDVVYVTPDVLSEEQVRLLYAIKLAHGAPRLPRRAGLTVVRRRRGPILVPADVPSASRIYNLDDLNDDSGNNVALTANPGTGSIVQVAGPDGSRDTARSYAGAHTGDSATDAGLPNLLTARSYGIWFKVVQGNGGALIGWGTLTTADTRLSVNAASAALRSDNAGDSIGAVNVQDGQWHHAAVVEDNAAVDGVKRKLYIDGRLVSSSTVMNSITLAGAARFRIGANPDGTNPFNGQLGRGFVSAAALTPDQIRTIFLKGAQSVGLSPKNAGEHVERIDATNIYFIGDTLDGQFRVDLEVAA